MGRLDADDVETHYQQPSVMGRILPPDAEARLAFADAALALAGHEVISPVIRDLLERRALGELTTEEAIAGVCRHV